MARIVLTSDLSQQFTGGVSEIEMTAKNVRELVRELDKKFPGLGDQLREGMAVAIDGELYQEPYLQTIEPNSEVYFLPPIGGG